MDLKRTWVGKLAADLFNLRHKQRETASAAYADLLAGKVTDPVRADEIIRANDKTVEESVSELQDSQRVDELREAVASESKLYEEERLEIKRDNGELSQWWREVNAERVRRAEIISARIAKCESRHRAIQARKQEIDRLVGAEGLQPYFTAKATWGNAITEAREKRQRANANIELAGQYDKKAETLLRSAIIAERANGERETVEADRLRSEAEQLIRDAVEMDQLAKVNDPKVAREKLYELV